VSILAVSLTLKECCTRQRNALSRSTLVLLLRAASCITMVGLSTGCHGELFCRESLGSILSTYAKALHSLASLYQHYFFFHPYNLANTVGHALSIDRGPCRSVEKICERICESKLKSDGSSLHRPFTNASIASPSQDSLCSLQRSLSLNGRLKA
jgi:hypothetical protein